MNDYWRFIVKALPFTAGVILLLVGMAYLLEFVNDLRIGEEDFWSFVFFFAIGLPTVLYGINKLSAESTGGQEQ